MDNVEGTQGVPLTVFGGAVPELAPEDLPEGASPFNQDVDYNPGSVLTRAGRTNQYYYAALNNARRNFRVSSGATRSRGSTSRFRLANLGAISYRARGKDQR